MTFFHLACALEPAPAAVESGTWIPKPISICFKRTDLTGKCQKGTWVLCTHLKGKLTNRNGDVSSTNDTEAKGRSKISLSRDLKHLFCGGQQMLSCHFLKVQHVIKLCPVIWLPSLYEAMKQLEMWTVQVEMCCNYENTPDFFLLRLTRWMWTISLINCSWLLVKQKHFGYIEFNRICYLKLISPVSFYFFQHD